MYNDYLKETGAANTSNNIFASACYSPITDLEHSDMAYEWMFGEVPAWTGPVNEELSKHLKESFDKYQASLKLQGKDKFGTLTADNYQEYLLKYYLIPSANQYLGNLNNNDREKYLQLNNWISWNDKKASINFAYYLNHVGRMKGLPAFDDFELRQPEPSLFGDFKTNARHFTDFSLRETTNNPDTIISDELKTVVNLMDPMYFIAQKNKDCAGYWWLRNGTSDNHTSQTVMINLATSLENQDKDVNTWLFWDGGHCSDDDPEGLIQWIGKISKQEK